MAVYELIFALGIFLGIVSFIALIVIVYWQG